MSGLFKAESGITGMRLVSCSFSDAGKARKTNQDAVNDFVCGDCGIFLVADGMGGHSEGERASGTVQKAVTEWWNAYLKKGCIIDTRYAVDGLKAQLESANREIREATEESQICGAAAVLLLIQRNQYVLLWAGDSRCYLTERHFLSHRCRQLTSDDVWEYQPSVISNFSLEEIRTHPNRGKLIRAVGVNENLQCSVSTGLVQNNMLFMLCSDGVHKYMDPHELESKMKACAGARAMEKCLEQLKKRIYEKGAPDNLSCVMVRVER